MSVARKKRPAQSRPPCHTRRFISVRGSCSSIPLRTLAATTMHNQARAGAAALFPEVADEA